jgi:hypothetical protein
MISSSYTKSYFNFLVKSTLILTHLHLYVVLEGTFLANIEK